jgi:hypothetical protein
MDVFLIPLFAASFESLSQTENFKIIQGELTIYMIISPTLIFLKNTMVGKGQP